LGQEAIEEAVVAESGQQSEALQLVRRYQITESLARGGLCEVYRGDDLVLRRPVAVKGIPAALAPTYYAALRKTAALSHPAVIAFYDAIEEGGRLYLVQEYVPARSLAAYIEAGVPTERALALVAQIARAIGYAHAQGVVHGDLTPSSVLVDRHATVRLNNFALPPDTRYILTLERQIRSAVWVERAQTNPATRPADSEHADAAVAETEVTRATLKGPAEGQPEGAERDIWAIGALLWLLLTMPVRVGGEETRQFRDDVPEPAREMVRQCLVGDTNSRIRSAEVLAGRLDAVAGDLRRARPVAAPLTPPALRAAREAPADLGVWPEAEPALVAAGDPLPPARDWAGVALAGASTANAPTDPVAADPTATQPARHFGDTPMPPRFTSPPHAPNQMPSTHTGIPSVPHWEIPIEPRAAVTGGVAGGIRLPTVIVLGVILFVIFFVIGYIVPSLFAR
jgi:hypothetical protein